MEEIEYDMDQMFDLENVQHKDHVAGFMQWGEHRDIDELYEMHEITQFLKDGWYKIAWKDCPMLSLEGNTMIYDDGLLFEFTEKYITWPSLPTRPDSRFRRDPCAVVLPKGAKRTDRNKGFHFVALLNGDESGNEDLVLILEIRLGSSILIDILKALYTGTTAAIRGTKTFFETFTGCRQGGLESPVNFNIYINFVLRCAENEVLSMYPDTGLKYPYLIPGHRPTREQRRIAGLSGTERMRIILYADDIVLICTNLQELQDISTDKTETMAFNVTEEIMSSESLLKIGNTPFKNFREFKYLSHKISNATNTDHLVQSISSAFKKWNELKHILTDQRIYIKTRIRIREACIRSRLLYSIQAFS